ncbi:thiamine-phosphate diphosphorylase [marine bacterium AO1-C]|nr:thiamine-phosphate diphosphorylase [marine bacterium AO1-C]
MSRLQYITQIGGDFIDHREAAEGACKAGCDWIQLRVKYMSAHHLLPIARRVKKICEAYQAKLIVNDRPAIAKGAAADGVHLGKEDMSPVEVRRILGEDIIIGGTANTFEDIKRLADARVDYIGLGPFRFTTTKDNLSPILGLEGYKEIIEQCKAEKIDIPIVAIGGIVTEDVADIMQTGVHGIAVSGLITHAPKRGELVKHLQDILTS